jgi:hypothetical protein
MRRGFKGNLVFDRKWLRRAKIDHKETGQWVHGFICNE